MATAQAEIITGPKVHKWTREEYYKMAGAGLFNDKRVELIEGTLVEYGHKRPLYCTAVTLVGNELREKASRGCGVFRR